MLSSNTSMAGRINKHLKLFVGNIPWTVSRRELRDYFQKFGPVKQASVLFNKETGMSRGFGFIQFGTRESYVAAISQNSHVIDQYKVILAAAGKGNVSDIGTDERRNTERDQTSS